MLGRIRTLALLALLSSIPAAADAGAAPPVAVSPGGARTVEAAGSTCPTFSWSATPGATGYELVAYALEAGGETAAEPALRVALPAGVTSWSPSGRECLATGGRYAWAVRAAAAEGAGDWSAARFFQVPTGPSPADVHEALAVLRRHLESEGGAGEAVAKLLRALEEPDAAGEEEAEPSAAGSEETTGAPARKVGGGGIVVDGEGVLTGLVTFGDWAQNGCAADQVPKWSGAAWTCGDDVTGSGAATDVVCTGCVGAGDLDDGAGSGVDADLLDGQEAAAFAEASHDHFGVQWNGDVSTPGLEVVNDGGSGIEGRTASSANDAGVFGQSTASDSKGLWGFNSATTGTAIGVFGETLSPTGRGVSGLARSASGGATAVFGQADGDTGAGVEGWATHGTGATAGVRGRSSSPAGAGGLFVNTGGGLLIAANDAANLVDLEFSVDDEGNVSATSFSGDGSGLTNVSAGDADTLDGVDSTGFAVAGHDHGGESWSLDLPDAAGLEIHNSGTGVAIGVHGSSASADGSGGHFVNTGGGALLTANDSDDPADPAELHVASDGTVTATAFVGDGSGLTDLPAGDAETLDGLDSGSFLRSDASSAVTTGVLGFETGTTLDVHKATLQVGTMTKTGTGLVANLNADQLDGLEATAFATSTHQHFGETWTGSGIRGFEVSNASTSAASFGILGKSLATSGTTTGVVGVSDSLQGIGVYGVVDESDPSATAIGVLGQTAGLSGATIGVKGEAFSPDSVAVYGQAQSDGAIGGFFINTGPGAATDRIVLAAGGDTNRSSLEFKVTASGDVYADGTFNCGPNLVDLNASGDLSETELDPCLRDSSPADFAEMLPLAAPGAEPGDVLAVDDHGRLVPTTTAFQASVVGVRSTRPSYLGNSRFAGDPGHTPLAITGLVPVKVTSENGPVRPGDLLVSSSTPGHAMRGGDDPPQGTVIGKALEPLAGERGTVLMLAVLQ